MLRFSTVCTVLLLLIAKPSLLLFGQQPAMTPQQQAEAAAQYQQAVQQQQELMQQGRPAPTVVVRADMAIAAGIAQATQAPFEALNAEQTNYLDQVLTAWEQHTAVIQQYQCTLSRWQYDPTQHPEWPAVVDKGVLQYAKPDKGLFRIDERQTIADKGPPVTYRPSGKFGEYWVCDGEYIHIRDRNEKKSMKIQLAPEQRHQGIHNSPLPFLFGVKAAEIKERYWVRPVPPPEGSQDVWLEAYPKRLDDAGNYLKVQVVLDAKDVLPRALIVFLPQWEPAHPHREVYEFTDRKKEWNLLDAMRQKLFMKEFIETNLPAGWQVIVEPYIDPQEAAQPGQGSPNPPQRVAQPPATQQQRR